MLYDLHGLGDNEQSLMNTGAWSLIQDLRQQHKIGEFLIVTPDGGRVFYINSRDGRERYSDFFLQEFMPAIEHKYRVRAGRNSRGITGMSMGGYGALRFAFAYPQLFSSVSAHSAALVAEPPRASNRGTGGRVSARGDAGRAVWKSHRPRLLECEQPLCSGQEKCRGDSPAQDLLRLRQRGQLWLRPGRERSCIEELDTLKVKHEFHIYPGGHGVEYFLAHVAASMEFHSRAFQEAR